MKIDKYFFGKIYEINTSCFMMMMLYQINQVMII